MSEEVWYCIPSALPASEAQPCIDAWMERGYKVAAFRDIGAEWVSCSMALHGNFIGWPKAVNSLCKFVLNVHPKVNWVITGGDDVWPDPKAVPSVVAGELTELFHGTMGIMQPDDDWQRGAPSVGSPWMGREYVMRANGGQGPYWPEYYHYYADNEQFHVSRRVGLLAFRLGMVHEHRVWARTGKPKPAHLGAAYARQAADKETYERRLNTGFPGSDPLEV